jgi:hypothetical protein
MKEGEMVRNWTETCLFLLWKLGLLYGAALLWNHRLELQRQDGGDVLYIVAAILLGNALVLHWRPLTPVGVWAMGKLRIQLSSLWTAILKAPSTRIAPGPALPDGGDGGRQGMEVLRS